MRTLLIERAAHMLRTRDPITLRSLVAGTAVSTMAVYTHFGDMDGLWRALRQEGFTRLGDQFALVTPSKDAVKDFTALVAVYLNTALAHPDLYRVMFDAAFELEDLKAADSTLEHLVQAAIRGTDTGRFSLTRSRWIWPRRVGPSPTAWSPWSPTGRSTGPPWPTEFRC